MTGTRAATVGRTGHSQLSSWQQQTFNEFSDATDTREAIGIGRRAAHFYWRETAAAGGQLAACSFVLTV
jgi:hypothetical protein